MAAARVQILPVRKLSPSSSDDSSPGPISTGQTEIPKRKRASKPKVRSGCNTCKIRRVKCDETKPECGRCSSTGRKCDGYVMKPRKKRATPKPRQKQEAAELTPEPTLTPEPEDTALELFQCPKLLFDDFDDSPAELRSLDFYHYKTAPALASYFDAEFWSRLVFQMSYGEPAVKHAMVALGVLHEQREQGLRRVPHLPTKVRAIADTDSAIAVHHEDPTEQFALVQYGKAISHLSERLSSGSSIEVALLACILFVCIEFLRGDAQSAVFHFKSGMSIAMSTFSANGSTAAKDTVERVRAQVMPFLNRIELLSTLNGDEVQGEYPVELLDAVPEKFENIKEARDSMIHLANLSVRFIRSMKEIKYTGLILPDQLARQATLLRQWEVWVGTFDTLLLSGTMTVRELDAAKTLRMHQVIGVIWLQRCTFPEECYTDKQLAEYETAVSLAEAVHGSNTLYNDRADPHNSTFLFDMEIVSPLFYCASSCRDPHIRRRAIALLKKTQRREGVWDSNKAAAACERVMYHEEINLTTLDGSELPPERDRIHGSDIASELGTNPKVHVLTLMSKPDGLQEPFKTWKEQITLP